MSPVRQPFETYDVTMPIYNQERNINEKTCYVIVILCSCQVLVAIGTSPFQVNPSWCEFHQQARKGRPWWGPSWSDLSGMLRGVLKRKPIGSITYVEF